MEWEEWFEVKIVAVARRLVGVDLPNVGITARLDVRCAVLFIPPRPRDECPDKS